MDIAPDLEQVARTRNLDGAEMLKATGISAVVCACGTLQIRFHDARERVFAVASVSRSDAPGFLLDAADSLEEHCVAAERESAAKVH